MLKYLTRDNVASVGKIAFAIAAGSYAYLYVTPVTKGKA